MQTILMATMLLSAVPADDPVDCAGWEQRVWDLKKAEDAQGTRWLQWMLTYDQETARVQELAARETELVAMLATLNQWLEEIDATDETSVFHTMAIDMIDQAETDLELTRALLYGTLVAVPGGGHNIVGGAIQAASWSKALADAFRNSWDAAKEATGRAKEQMRKACIGDNAPPFI